MKKYFDYFDDSSSESDEEKVDNDINGRYHEYLEEQKQVIVSVKTALSIAANRSKTATKVDAQQITTNLTEGNVFLLHDLGNRLFFSKQVKDIYYNQLKPKYLNNKFSILSTTQLKELLHEFANKEKIDITGIDALIKNPRVFIKSFVKQELNKILEAQNNDFVTQYIDSKINDIEKKFQGKSFNKSTLQELKGQGIPNFIIDSFNESFKTQAEKFVGKKRIFEGNTKENFGKIKDSIQIPDLIPKAILNLEEELNKFLEQKASIINKDLVLNRQTLKTGFTFKYNYENNDIYSFEKFLANIKLIHRSLKREMKNLGTWSEQKYEKLTVRYSKQLKEAQELSETHTVGKNSRASEVKNLDSYNSIIKEIQNIQQKTQLLDSDIAKALFSIIKTGQLQQNKIPDSKHVEKLYQIAYLLFGCEADRNPASMLTHAMFLELIQNEQNGYSFKTLVQKLPMAIEKAVVGMRKFNLFYGKYLSSKFFYDYEDGDRLQSMEEIISREIIILKDWLAWKKQTSGTTEKSVNTTTDNDENILGILINAIKQWYGIDLNYLNSSYKPEDIEMKAANDGKAESSLEPYLFREQVQELLIRVSSQKQINDFDSLKNEYKEYEEKSKRNDDIEGRSNAFNQKNNANYLYQNHDILKIQKQLLVDYSDFVQCNPVRVGGDQFALQTQDELVTLIKDAKDKTKFLGTFNPTGLHWIAFYIFKDQNNLMILYKDSQGNGAEAFLAILLKESVFNITTYTHNDCEQTSGLECGIFALKNMQIMAAQLTSNHAHFVTEMIFKNYKEWCKLEDAQKMRLGNDYSVYNFPELYKTQVINENKHQIMNAALFKELEKNHSNELQELASKVLSLQQDSYKLYNPSTEITDLQEGKILLEIVINSSEEMEYTYQYRLHFPKENNDKQNDLTLKLVVGQYEESDNKIVIKPEDIVDIEKIQKPNIHLIRNGLTQQIENVGSELYQELQKQLDYAHVLSGSGEFGEEKNIDYIHSYFGKYTLDALDHILHLRISDLQLKNIEIIQGIFIDQSHNNIPNLLSQILNSSESKFLVPLNLFNKHATGLIFEKSKDDTIQVTYLDSLNKEIPRELKQLIVDNLNIKIDFQQIFVEQQKYANCGSEVIENFIFYLTGKRVSQEKAIELHSKLVENALLNIDSCDVHLLFEKLSSEFSSDIHCGQPSYNSVQFYNDDYDNLHLEVVGDILIPSINAG